MAMPGSPWDHGQPQEGAIPTVLVLPDSCFSGLVTADIPFRAGSNVLFVLKGTLGKHRAQISLSFWQPIACALMGNSSDSFCFPPLLFWLCCIHGHEENYGLWGREVWFFLTKMMEVKKTGN